MQIHKIITELDEYLTATGCYAKANTDEEIENINTSVNANWQIKIEEALSSDLRTILHNDNLQIKQTRSIFEIMSDEQGATIFKSFLDLTDQDETMSVVVNLIVYHNNGFIYLGQSHTHESKYTGNSKTLERLFNELKKKERVGNFLHTNLYQLQFRDTPSEQKPSSSRFSLWLQKYSALNQGN
jgi:hypothetical protein